MTIYVVSHGEYSDYGICALFSSQELAQDYIDAITSKREEDSCRLNDIFTMELDPKTAEYIKAGRSLYRVHMLRDGTTETVHEITYYSALTTEQSGIWRRSTARAFQGKGIPDCLVVECFATDETHAVKIANEKRTQMIAMGEWDQD